MYAALELNYGPYLPENKDARILDLGRGMGLPGLDKVRQEGAMHTNDALRGAGALGVEPRRDAEGGTGDGLPGHGHHHGPVRERVQVTLGAPSSAYRQPAHHAARPARLSTARGNGSTVTWPHSKRCTSPGRAQTAPSRYLCSARWYKGSTEVWSTTPSAAGRLPGGACDSDTGGGA